MISDIQAQTTLDFAIAMGVFLIILAAVFMFIPSITVPFVDGTQDHTAAADRIASHLAEGALGEPDTPYHLTEACATAFFAENESEDIPDQCGFSGDTTAEHLGISDRISVYIELIWRGEAEDRHLCAEDGQVKLECNNNGIDYQIGDPPLDGLAETVSRRIVSFDTCDIPTATCDVTLRVVVY